MSIYQRPLRSDELMHASHKYIDKVRTKGGAWRYIYDLAGGKYKREAETHRAEANRNHRIAKQQLHKGDQQFEDMRINMRSGQAHSNALVNGNNFTTEQRKRTLEKVKEHARKSDIAYVKTKEHYDKGFDLRRKAESESRKADRANDKYKKSLAYKYDTRKQIANSTVNSVKKSVNKGKNFFKKLFG